MRVFCENCGTELNVPDGISNQGVRCGKCGYMFSASETNSSPTSNIAVQAVAKAAGMAPISGFSWSGLFQEVFEHHSNEEMERFWSSGSVGNIPGIDKIETAWPKPWVFVRSLLTTTIAFVILFAVFNIWKNINVLPGLLFIGSFAVPVTLVIFFFEMNIRKNVSLRMVMRTFLIGGTLSLFISMIFFDVSTALGLDWLGASVAGLAEEIGKLLAVVLFVKTIRYPYIHNGLLFGAAVGAGFAAFESAGYAMAFLLQSGSTKDMFTIMFMRAAFTGLCGHILWTGMSAAALWRVKGAEKFQWNMLFDFRFIRIFLIAMISHMIWNANWDFRLLTSYDKFILLGVIDWIVIFVIIQSGINQLKAEKSKYQFTPEMEPEVAEVIRIQKVYVEKLIEKPASEQEPEGHDPLEIRKEMRKVDERERTRQVPKFEGRTWQKYYKKDE